MASIDERVVSMSFENSVFESRVAVTMATLSKLDTAIANVGKTSGLENIEAQANKVTLTGPMSALDKLKQKLGFTTAGTTFSDLERDSQRVSFDGPMTAADKLQQKLGQVSAGTTFTDLEKASNKVSFEGVTNALDNITAKFSVLEGAAAVAFGNIASTAAMKLGGIAKSLSLGPITQGLEEYSTNLNSIQTILANTKASGADLNDVNAALQNLNKYSDQTIYNFGQMAKNIGTFTAAGVDLDTSTQAIKGIANLAALSGSNSQQASTAMYQLSQAISAGRVSLQDWNSVVNAGMGGTVFQRALAKTAEQMGTIKKGAVALKGPMKNVTIEGQSFRESIQAKPGEQSWLTSKVLTNTLKQFTGDLSDAELAAQGFSEAEIKAIQEQAQTAKHAATEVKTIGGVFDVVKESIGSGWAQTFQLIFGDFEEAKSTFTQLANFITGFTGRLSDARNAILKEWKELGGRTELIDGIKELFVNIRGWIKPVTDAFREIFPATTGKKLFELTQAFHQFAESLDTTDEFAENIFRTAKGLFAVLHIGWSVVKELIGIILDLVGIAGKSSGGFLAFTAGIGDFLVAVDNAVTKGGALKGIFQSIGAVVRVPLEIIKELAGALFGMFDGADPQKADGVASSMQAIDKALRPLRGVLDTVHKGWEKFLDLLGRIKEAVEPAFTKILDTLGNFGNAVANAFQNINWDTALNALETGLVGAIFLKIKSALGGMSEELGGGIFQNINGILKGLTTTLGEMQDTLKAATLFLIAAAIGALAVSILLLSTIDPQAMSRSLSAIAIGLGELVGAMAIMEKLAKGGAFAKMPFIAGSMVLLAGAVLILAGAMKVMSSMSWEEIAKGLVGVAGSIAVIAGATQLLNGPKLLVAAAGMLPLAIALVIMAGAMKIFASMSWEEIGKGLAGVVGGLLAIAGAMQLMPMNLPITGAGLVLVAFGLNLLAGAIGAFGAMDLKTMVQGILGIAGAIVAIGLSVGLMPPTLPLIAAGLVLLSIALGGIAAVIGILGNMDVTTLVKGIAAIGASLLVLAGGLYLMTGTIGGSLALLAAAAALAILGPTLAFMGTLEWGTIFKGLAAIALTLGVIAVVGLVAAPALIALGVGLALIGLGITAIGGGLYLIAKGFQLIGAEGAKGIAAVIAAIGAFILIFPKMVIDFVKGLVTILGEVVKLVPAIVTALVSIVTTLLDAIIDLAPKLAEAINAIIAGLLTILQTNSPKFVAAGFQLLQDILKGLRDNISEIVTLATDIVVKLLDTLGTNAGRLVAAGTNLLIKFLNGAKAKVPEIIPVAVSLLTKFINAVANKIPDIVTAATNLIVKFIDTIATNVHRFVEAGTNLIIKFLDGIEEAIPRIVTKGTRLASRFLHAIADGLVDLAQVGFDAIIDFLHGIADAIRENDDELFNAGADILDAIIDGVVDAAGRLAGPLKRAIEHLFGLLPGWAKKILGIHSPSAVFQEIGKNTLMGFSKGLEDNTKPTVETMGGIATNLIDKFKGVFGIASPSKVMQELGKAVGEGFAKGLEGSETDIRNAFSDLRGKMNDEIRDLRENIKTESAHLKELLSADKPDKKAIRESMALLREYRADLENVTEARKFMNTSLKDERDQLIGLSKQYEELTAQLDKAQQDLDTLIRERDDFAKSTAESFSKLPEFDTEAQDPVADYKKKLADQIAATKKFYETMKKLRDAGLDDITFKKLLSEGIGAQDMADAILAGGSTAINSINELDTQLTDVATDLGEGAADALYANGIKMAQGIVDGLKSQEAALKKQMEDLAKWLVDAIKKELGIKSPSAVFADIAKLTAQGLIKGLKDSTKGVTDAATGLGEDAANAMQEALAGNVDADPVITPVLDLSKVEKEAGKLGDLTNVTPITAAASFGQASAISAEQAKQLADVAAAQAASGPTFQFEQNNYSPEALSDIEIYRQTKNQLSQVKNALGLTT